MFFRIILTAFFICILTACSVSYNSQRHESGSNVIYGNEVLAFTIEMPSGWYLPAIDDTDPHFYETKMCAESYSTTCAAFEIQNHDTEFIEGPDAAFNTASSNGLNPQRYSTLIPGAVVIRTSPEAGAEGWYFEYHVFFTKSKRRFLIFSNDKNLENSIFVTLKSRN